ncbi:fumarylacetoacetate hydrolase family protein [Saxibacter everestensis]|uniref:Fumarylacetoacetate hydrolase family protein n=1 Tax=Saxibacter everestensis TaxID=2909229 RepID=A0ABY8QQW1_9MICO|nr:fumarylacetoacetate hydrolase family protein [Brevibacteriaceae bacterium ZFBP1038]
MHIVRYRYQGRISIGILEGETVRRLPHDSMSALLALPLSDIRSQVDAAPTTEERPVHDVDLLAPLDGNTEVWAAGVTYLRSKDARVEESDQASVYDLVYDAERAEIFFKSVAWRVVTDGDPVGIRADSVNSVPESELALVLNAAGERVGYLVCNDMSSRSIEGENPIYLPQAKIYAGACALSPGIAPAWEVGAPEALSVSCWVERDGARVFFGESHTGQIKRGLDELTELLFRADHFPGGAVLSTGTGIVPDLDFRLRAGDVIEIEIPGVGRLRNEVAVGKDAFGGG